MMDDFNKDVKLRDEIIFGEYIPYVRGCGGIRSFDGMTVDTLKKLVELKFADPDERQNDSPKIREFIEFMENHKGYTVNGYAVALHREDYRVSVDAIQHTGKLEDGKELAQFATFCKNSDEFDPEEGYAWWD